MRLDDTTLATTFSGDAYTIDNGGTVNHILNDPNGAGIYVVIPTESSSNVDSSHIIHVTEGSDGLYQISPNESFIQLDRGSDYLCGSIFITDAGDLAYASSGDLKIVDSETGQTSTIFDGMGQVQYFSNSL